MFEDKDEGEFVTVREIVNYFEQQFNKQHKEYIRELRITRWLYVAFIVWVVVWATMGLLTGA